jgi:hypothetical protein
LEWHALVVWSVCAVVVLPVLAFGLRPALRRMMRKAELQPA